MKRAHATRPTHGKSPDVGAFRRPKLSAQRPECVLEARLETTAAASERLLDALGAGMRDFVLTSTDGRLSARVRLTLANVSTTEHRVGGASIVVDWSQLTISSGPRRVLLSRIELRLLAALLEAGGRVSHRHDLIHRIWPDDSRGVGERQNALGVYVCSLRKRLAAIGVGSALCTVRGVGYRLTI